MSMAAAEREEGCGAHTRIEWNRATVADKLKNTPSLRHTHIHFKHGRLGAYLESTANVKLEDPTVKWESKDPPRDDHDTPDWLNATEWLDSSKVLQSKAAALVSLLRQSQRTVVYSGAGISVAANIKQAAKSGSRISKPVRGREAKPTATHYYLTALHEAGLVHHWVQQNHDGLPQKAGYPQHHINEIHGSWFDPSNVVVKYDGSLRDDLYDDMCEAAENADLVIVVGTSLSGLNSDQLAETPAVYSQRGGSYSGGARLGFVIINLQQTRLDGLASLRINATSDAALKALVDLLDVTPRMVPYDFSKIPRKVLVPYDKNGNLTSSKKKMWLDLSDGTKIRLHSKHNCQGAKQGMYMHIGKSVRAPVTFLGVTRAPSDGCGEVVKAHIPTATIQLSVGGSKMSLGCWWILAAQQGLVEQIPVVNSNPVFET